MSNRFDQASLMVKKLLNEAQADQSRRLEEDEALVSRWQKYGLLDGVKGRLKQARRARLYENQAQYMKAKLLTEASTNADIQGFIAVAFPAVRRVLDKSMIEDFVNVTPMKGPSGLVYYIDYKYSTNKGGVGGYLNTGSSVYGTKTGPDQYNPLTNDAEGGLYNFNSTAYSRREVVTTASATGSANWFTGTVLTASNSNHLQLVQYDPEAVRAMNGDKLVEIRCSGLWLSATNAGTWGNVNFATSNADVNLLTSWVVLSGSSTATATGVPGTPVPVGLAGHRKLLRHLTRKDGDDVVFYLSASSSAAAAIMGDVADNHVAPTGAWNNSLSLSFPITQGVSSVSGVAGSFSFSPAFESDFLTTTEVAIPELDFSIESKNINTESRKMKAKWSPEMAQDINAFYGINAEEALTQLLTDHMAAEIQSEIMTMLLQNASAANYYWSRRPGKFLDKTTGETASGSPDFTGHQQDWYRTLIEAIFEVCAQIRKRTVLGDANFLVTSPEVAVILKNTLEWKAKEEKRGEYRIGSVESGSLQGTLKVYEHSYFPENKILIGFKPQGGEVEELLGGGFVHAPYVPIIVSPIVADPEDFTPRRMVMSRYANEVLRGDFYGTVTVLDMNFTA